jgi:hypothetical protein
MKTQTLLLTIAGCLTTVSLFAHSTHSSHSAEKARTIKQTYKMTYTSAAAKTADLDCILTSPNLFFGCELGEKKLNKEVDTMAARIAYDNSLHVKLIAVSLEDLGLTGNNISYTEIKEAAQKLGYKLCPSQIGPELCVLSQNKPQNMEKLGLPKNTNIYIAMDEISETSNMFYNGYYYGFKKDYVFSVTEKGQSLKLGYFVTQFANYTSNFSSKDVMIFINGMENTEDYAAINPVR